MWVTINDDYFSARVLESIEGFNDSINNAINYFHDKATSNSVSNSDDYFSDNSGIDHSTGDEFGGINSAATSCLPIWTTVIDTIDTVEYISPQYVTIVVDDINNTGDHSSDYGTVDGSEPSVDPSPAIEKLKIGDRVETEWPSGNTYYGKTQFVNFLYIRSYTMMGTVSK